MPLYEYKCRSCARVFESYRRLSDEKTIETCPACGGTAERLGISLVSAKGPGSGGSPTGSCGSGSRRSPFS